MKNFRKYGKILEGRKQLLFLSIQMTWWALWSFVGRWEREREKERDRPDICDQQQEKQEHDGRGKIFPLLSNNNRYKVCICGCVCVWDRATSSSSKERERERDCSFTLRYWQCACVPESMLTLCPTFWLMMLHKRRRGNIPQCHTARPLGWIDGWMDGQTQGGECKGGWKLYQVIAEPVCCRSTNSRSRFLDFWTFVMSRRIKKINFRSRISK